LTLLPILWQIHLMSVEVKITVAEQFGQIATASRPQSSPPSFGRVRQVVKVKIFDLRHTAC